MLSSLKLKSATPESTDRVPADTAVPEPKFWALIQTASLEFLSTLQLLIQRAQFLTGATGVAIALQESNQLTYCVSVGVFAHETGTLVDTSRNVIAECIATRRPSSSSGASGNHDTAIAAVPVIRQDKLAGILELTADRDCFSDEDILTVTRLVEMVKTALDHMEAAEQAGTRIFEDRPLEKEAEPPPTSAPVTSPNPRQMYSPPSKVSSPPPPAASTVRTCQSCGFPVSEGRNLCLDCEQDPSAVAVAEAPLLTIEKQESWLSAHGYTIASLLVTVLVVVILLWLR
jgi:hypothetical protein